MNKLNTSILLSLLMISSVSEAQQLRPANSMKRIPAQTATTDESATTDSSTNTDTTFDDSAASSPDDNDAAFEEAAKANAEAAGNNTTSDSESAAGVTTARPRAKRLPITSLSSWAVGVTTLQWNENMTVSQLGTTTSSNMTFNGMGLQVQKETIFLQWGWSVGAMLAAGRANAGPFGNDLKIDRQNFSMLAITPRVFWRLSNKVNIGGTALVYMRNIDLPSGNGVDATAGRKNNAAILADMNLRIFKAWDFYQAIGPIAEGAYLWKIGVNYRY
jgi:hypothetical protein